MRKEGFYWTKHRLRKEITIAQYIPEVADNLKWQIIGSVLWFQDKDFDWIDEKPIDNGGI